MNTTNPNPSPDEPPKVQSPEVTFNLFINRLIGPNKIVTNCKSHFYTILNYIKTNGIISDVQPQVIGGSIIDPNEKIIRTAMESCPFKCLISGVGG